MRSPGVSMVPEAMTAFWLASVAATQFRIDAEARHLPQAKVDVDDLVLHADEIHLAHVAHAQQLGADELGLVAQLAIREAVAGQRVDHAVDIAEVVVEERTDRALRQLAADVAYLLAHLVPLVGHGFRRRVVAQVDHDRGFARLGVAGDEVEVFERLERLLQPVGELFGGLDGVGARPERAHHHDLDGERRVFIAAEAVVGAQSREQRDHHEEADERLVSERPRGEIEAAVLAGALRAPRSLRLLGRQLHFLAGREPVHAGRHHALTGANAFGDVRRDRCRSARP